MRNSNENIGNRNRKLTAPCLNQLDYDVPQNNFRTNRNTESRKLWALRKEHTNFPKILAQAQNSRRQ